MKYKTVFDIATSGYGAWSFLFIGCTLVLVGVLLLKFHKDLPMGRKTTERSKKIFAICFLAFAVLWTIGTTAGTYYQYRSLLHALNTGNFQITEGRVVDFAPMPWSGHAEEKFAVNGQHFSYSDYTVTSGFNNTKSHGGPIRTGLAVRISHVGNTIIKLEIAE